MQVAWHFGLGRFCGFLTFRRILQEAIAWAHSCQRSRPEDSESKWTHSTVLYGSMTAGPMTVTAHPSSKRMDRQPIPIHITSASLRRDPVNVKLGLQRAGHFAAGFLAKTDRSNSPGCRECSPQMATVAQREGQCDKAVQRQSQVYLHH